MSTFVTWVVLCLMFVGLGKLARGAASLAKNNPTAAATGVKILAGLLKKK